MNPSVLFSVMAFASAVLVAGLLYALRRAKRELALEEAERLLRREFDEALKGEADRDTNTT
ncbi:MAG: hypothetical protein U0174_27995 [Polyangiaceae bacterium]